MLLATTQVEDFDRFMDYLLHDGRREAQAARLQRTRSCSATPPRTTASGSIFDWDEQGWQSFVSDPEVPPIMKEAGSQVQAGGRPSSPATARPDQRRLLG